MCSVKIRQQMNYEASVKSKENTPQWGNISQWESWIQFIDINFSLSWASTQLLCPWVNMITDQFIHSFVHSIIHLTNIYRNWAFTLCHNQRYMRQSPPSSSSQPSGADRPATESSWYWVIRKVTEAVPNAGRPKGGTTLWEGQGRLYRGSDTWAQCWKLRSR